MILLKEGSQSKMKKAKFLSLMAAKRIKALVMAWSCSLRLLNSSLPWTTNSYPAKLPTRQKTKIRRLSLTLKEAISYLKIQLAIQNWTTSWKIQELQIRTKIRIKVNHRAPARSPKFKAKSWSLEDFQAKSNNNWGRRVLGQELAQIREVLACSTAINLLNPGLK